MNPPPKPADAGPLDPAAVVLRFLESAGRPEEARFYLELFRACPRQQFAVLHIDANVARDAAEAVVLDLRFLTALGLYPSVVLGLFQPADAAAQARRLGRRLAAAAVPTESIAAGDPEAGERVEAALGLGRVPLVAFAPVPGETPASRFDLLSRLLTRLATRKLIFLHRPGGLRVGGALVPIVNLTTEATALLSARSLSRKEAMIVEQSRRLVLERTVPPLLVAVASPLSLLRELFTVKGAGTLLRRGATIVRHQGWAGVERPRLGQLLESSFGRPCLPAFFDREVAWVYREEGWRGAAVLAATPLGSYLSKFAVAAEAQGEGIARDLWDALATDHPVVYWRARPDNPIAGWYARLADGLERLPEWSIYWRGLPIDRIPDAIADASGRPVDMPQT